MRTTLKIVFQFLVFALLWGNGCATAPSPALPAGPPDAAWLSIPLQVDPPVSRIGHGEKVVISMDPSWIADLQDWRVNEFGTESFDETGNPRGVELIDNSTVVYTTPSEGNGTVVISVVVEENRTRGEGRLQLIVE